jgi:hypothetical protein
LKFRFGSWSPTVTLSGTIAADAPTVSLARYLQFGKLVVALARIELTGVTGIGPTISITLPVNANRSPNVDVIQLGWHKIDAAIWQSPLVYIGSATLASLLRTDAEFNFVGNSVSAGYFLIYEAA